MSTASLPKVALFVSVLVALAGCTKAPDGPPTQDEAKRNGLTPAAFRYNVSDLTNYCKGMDVIVTTAGSTAEEALANSEKVRVDQLLDKYPEQPPLELIDPVTTQSEILGRNTWMLWCAGNEGFWDWLDNHSYGLTDFLKLIDSRQRATRFANAGLINEPETKAATEPDQYGLYIDVPAAPPTRLQPIESIYGRSTGILGLRLFKNPNFDAKAAAAWDPQRYFNDPTYYNNPKLVRPYRVGMSCAFCHASFSPLNPPANPVEPQWANISGNIGAQYLRIRAVFGLLLDKKNFVYHLLDSQLPGTVDTSLIASDNINNSNAMNSVFNLKTRIVRSFINSPEVQLGASLTQPAVWGNAHGVGPADGPAPFVWKYNPATRQIDYVGLQGDVIPYGLVEELKKTNIPGTDRPFYPLVAAENDSRNRYVPHILFDGADSIGGWGALARVFLNIGEFWERWNELHTPLIGGTPQKPFAIDYCVQNSVYWNATQERVGPLRDYFLKISGKMPLLAAAGGRHRAVEHGGDPVRNVDISQLAHGRKVFAHNCIVCHSSTQYPARDAEQAKWAAIGEFWDHDPGKWLRDPGYLKWAEEAVETPEFWRDNYLSTDLRIQVALVGTNSKRAVATNALGGHMWSDFSSLSYKQLPSPGEIPYFDPYDGPNGKDKTYVPRQTTPPESPNHGGGVGFYRVPTLVSIWSTAPLLHNNSLGVFTNDPSLDGRLVAFDDAIRKLLWPDLRLKISAVDTHPLNEATEERLKKDHGLIWRTTEKTYLELPAEQVPALLSGLPIAKLHAFLGWATMFAAFPWLPGTIFFVLSFLLLYFTGRIKGSRGGDIQAQRRRALTRWLGLTSLVLSLLLTVAIYFANGKIANVRIGPFPKGTPVDLLANLNLDLVDTGLLGPNANTPEAKRDRDKLIHTFFTTVDTLRQIDTQHLTDAEAEKLLREKVAPALMEVNKAPDFVMDKGHYYPWFRDMTDEDKKALIELLKTF